jgi:hypothetical protein
VSGKPAFGTAASQASTVYIHADWARRDVAFAGYSITYSMDITVRDIVGKNLEAHPDRAVELERVLGVSLDWNIPLVRDDSILVLRI